MSEKLEHILRIQRNKDNHNDMRLVCLQTKKVLGFIQSWKRGEETIFRAIINMGNGEVKSMNSLEPLNLVKFICEKREIPYSLPTNFSEKTE